MIQVTLKLLGPFRACSAGAQSGGEELLELVPGSSLSQVLGRVPLPGGAPRVVLLNGVQQDGDAQLSDGDVITVFPPIAGGSGQDMRELSAGTGPYTVSASLQTFGADVLIAVWGGTRPHVGALAVSTPRPGSAPEEARSSTVLQFSFPGHRDDVVASRVSARVAAALQRTVTVSAGIHVPDISPAGIEAVLANTDTLIEKIISALGGRAPEA
jgi:hypothetical protein